MTRAVIAPRVLIPPRAGRLPPWLKGRASLYFDPTDDLLAGTIPADLTGSGAWTILARLRPATFHTATNRGAVSFGTNAAAQGAFLGQVISGSKPYIGGGLIGTTLADSRVASSSEWSDCMIRYAGGAGGALTLVVNGRSTAGVATGNITGTVAEIGRLLVAGTCFGGRVCDARILSRAISDAEYDEWRLGTSAPVTTRRLWTCENPGYGTTCHEEIGNTEDVITGALWSPDVPFRRRRVVEDVAAAFLANGTATMTVPANAAFRPGAASFSILGWNRNDSPDTADRIFRLTDIGTADEVRIWRPAGAFPYFMVNDGAGVSVSLNGMRNYPPGWCLIAAVCDKAAGLLRFSLNASCPVVAAWAGGAVDPAGSLQVSVSGGPARGGCNDWHWYNGKALTWDEIEAFYFDGVVPDPGVATHIGWGMREGAGVTVASSPAGYPGTLSAASWTTATRCHARTTA